MKSSMIDFSPIENQSVEDLFEYASDDLVSRYIGWPLLNAPYEAESFRNGLIEKEQAGTHYYWTIKLKGENKAIGTIMIFNINYEAKYGEIGYVLHRDYWHRGIMTEAIQCLEGYAFDVLKLHKLYAYVVKSNIGSAKVLEKRAFVLEGRLKDHYWIDSEYDDCFVYGKII